MADNYTTNENLYYNDDFNIVLIDPNTVVDSNGEKKSRTIRQENLVMYANLEAITVPRTKLAIGQDVETGVSNVRIADINFLKPNDKNFFDTSYTDESTGARSTQGVGINQITVNQGRNPQQPNYVDTQILGIRDINVDIKFNGVPQVTMTLVDVQGKCLFQTGGNSPYSVFLYYPYPNFLLTLKGFYGKAIQYQLMLLTFETSFEASTGNYIVTLKFISRTSAKLDDVRLGYLYALPHMFNSYTTSNPQIPNTSNTGTASVQSNGVGNTQELTVTKTSKGYSKIEQVFKQYKEKKLIEQDVPVLTINEMSLKLQKYTEFLNKEFEKLPFEDIVSLERYNDSVNEFSTQLIGWRDKYLDSTKQLVLNNSFKNTRVLPLTNLINNLSGQTSELPSNAKLVSDSETDLKALLDKYYKIFNSVPGPLAKQITFSETEFKINAFKLKFTESDIDFLATYSAQGGPPVNNPETDVPFKIFKENLTNQLRNNGTLITVSTGTTEPISTGNRYYYTLDREIENIKSIKGQLEQKRKQESDRLNNILKTRIRTNGNVKDLSFRPTVRNVIGVLMASVDAFYQLMNEVHTKAYDMKDNTARLKAIITNAPSQEGKNIVQSTSTQNKNLWVYPWPQFVQTKELQGKVEYEVTYPGAKDVKDTIQAYNPNIWPEVEFVEEYLTAVLQKDRNFNNDVQPNDNIVLKYTPEHAIEIPLQNTVFNQLSNPPLNYVYEIYERLYMNAFYSGLLYIDTNSNLEYTVSDVEFSNIQQSSPQGELRNLIIDTLPRQKLYDYLSTTTPLGSTGGTLWNTFTAQQFVTPYIKQQVDNSFGLLPPKEFQASNTNPIKLQSLDNITKFVKDNRTGQLSIFDTYPFRISSFGEIMDGKPNEQNRYQTINTYSFDTKKLILTNYSGNNLKPYTRKNTTTATYTDTIIKNRNIGDFYGLRYASDGKFFTEGNLTYTSDPNIGTKQTTSMLNTPYFINSIIQAGSGDTVTTPITTAYLFLNSLPLSTLYEKYLDLTDGNKKDFIFAGFNKFSAIHDIPYAWILKVGSIWYRYKQYIEKKTDILDSVWKNFDYQKAYDPVSSNPRKTYKIPYDSNDNTPKNFTLLKTTTIQNGFYPLLMNSFFKLITNNNLFVNSGGTLTWDLDTAQDTFLDLEIKATSTPITVPTGPITSYYSYLVISNQYQAQVGTSFFGQKLLFPSAGHLPFQQSYFELRDQTSQQRVEVAELQGSSAMFNGSARGLWNAPNYGWFNNSDLKKPTPLEYIKYVTPTDVTQPDFSIGQQYSSVEDLFGVFTKKQLDEFEYEFLEFCKTDGSSKIYKPEGDDTTFNNIINILKKMFIVDTPEIDSAKLAESQAANFTDVIQKLIEIKVYMKIGNPKKFDRQQLGYFSNNSKFVPNTPFDYGGNYAVTPDKLPKPGGLTLQQSQTNYKSEWDALYKNVGFSTINGIEYTGTGSTIYDFFRDNNIPFTVSNIELLAPLIKIYATQKKLDNTYNKTKFANDISTILTKVEDKRATIELMMRGKFGSLGNIKQAEVQSDNTTLDGDVIKLEQWELFKSINDKWVSGMKLPENLIFEEFLFFDRANRDIGDELIINIDTIRKYCTWDNASTSIMSLIREVLSNNRMNFFVMPAYINFYGKKSDDNRNLSIVNNANDVFGSYNYVDFTSFAPKFLCQYIDRPSQTLSLDNDPNYPFKDDGFDLGNPTNNPIRQTQSVTRTDRNNKAVGFVVDFGTMNQSVFKSVDINQEQGVSSSEQIQTVIDIGNQSSGKKTMQQTTALFEFYKNRSYTSTVKTLGNVMIQPTMYFVLRHMPMFNGTYIIRNVKHSISPGSFDTTFEGQRVSTNINTRITDELASVNEDFTKKLNDKVKQFVTNNELVTFNSNINQYVTGQQGKNFKLESKIPYLGTIKKTEDSQTQDCSININSSFGTLNGVTLSESSISPKQLISDLKKVISGNSELDRIHRIFLFSMLYLQGYSTDDISSKLEYKQNNLYGVVTDVEFGGSLPSLVNGYRCLKSIDGTVRPYANFESIISCLNFMEGYYKNKIMLTFGDLQIDFTNKQKLEILYDRIISLYYTTWYTSGKLQKKYTEDNNYSSWTIKVKWAVTQALSSGL